MEHTRITEPVCLQRKPPATGTCTATFSCPPTDCHTLMLHTIGVFGFQVAGFYNCDVQDDDRWLRTMQTRHSMVGDYTYIIAGIS